MKTVRLKTRLPWGLLFIGDLNAKEYSASHYQGILSNSLDTALLEAVREEDGECSLAISCSEPKELDFLGKVNLQCNSGTLVVRNAENKNLARISVPAGSLTLAFYVSGLHEPNVIKVSVRWPATGVTPSSCRDFSREQINIVEKMIKEMRQSALTNGGGLQ